ncbi:MAG TPA: NADH-quinone oxidoreductase subunit I [Clostridia bacterium]|nr:NADH-quinone oxidoreductase subunit I [Clostridia bacterium]
MKKRAGKMVPYMMGMLIKKPATVKYPLTPATVPPNFRGAIKFDQDSCIGCKMCERVCPANAIRIIKVEGEEKKFQARMHLDRCIFCAQCVDSCPKHSLHSTDRFELATRDKSSLEVDI